MTSHTRAAARLLAVLAAACSKDSTAPPKPASLDAGATAVASATVGAALATQPTFVVKDAGGAVLGNVAVSVAITAGGGVLTGAPTKTQNGPTPVGAWTLGTVAGVNTITVTVTGLAPLTFSVTGTPDAPTALTVTSGNNQLAVAGTPVPVAIAFKLADKFGNGIPGTTLSFQVTSGEGFLSGAGAQTDANGVANAPPWTLGKINVAQQISATVAGLSATATVSISSNYHAEVRFFGPVPDPNYAAAFTRAGNKVNAEISGGMTPVPLLGFDVANQCGASGAPVVNETVQTLLVFVTIKPIDGVGRILASSGPCIVRTSTRFPVVGTMTFDVADVAQLFSTSQLNDVALHEIQHVVGFGTLWAFPPSLGSLIINAGTSQSAFVGPNAGAACAQVGGTQAVCSPGILLENTGGAGTVDGHWRKTTFKAELMTGFISAPGTPMPLSLMTIASLSDLGFTVNSNVADGYTVTSAVGASLQVLRRAQGLSMEDAREELLAPRFEVGRDGRVNRLTPPLR